MDKKEMNPNLSKFLLEQTNGDFSTISSTDFLRSPYIISVGVRMLRKHVEKYPTQLGKVFLFNSSYRQEYSKSYNNKEFVTSSQALHLVESLNSKYSYPYFKVVFIVDNPLFNSTKNFVKGKPKEKIIEETKEEKPKFRVIEVDWV